MKKTVIIGIDSATFDFIQPMIQEGRLPNLSSLMRNGCWGRLQSTMPPVTPPAWVSFMTGKNPGKHGVFDFYAAPSYGYARPVWNSRYIRSKTIWRILSDNGFKVGVINLPMTHPPEEINGFMIPGMQYSFDGQAFSHPPELMLEIKENIGDYRVLYGDLECLYTNDMDRLLEEWREIFETRRRAILYLMEHKKWDVFMPVFYSIDVMQHHFWKFFDKGHPQYNQELSLKYGNVVSEFYEKTDSVIGEILERITKDATIIVLSDHGAGPEKEAFYLNNWLHQEGFLKYREIFSPLWRMRLPHLFYKTMRRLGFHGIAWTVSLDKLKTLGRAIDPREGLNIPFFIDWKRTTAYAGNHTEQGIYINLKGRESLGIVERGKEYESVRESIIKRLKELKDPVSGRAVEIKAYKKEDVYSGPCIDDAPDIFLEIKKGECLSQKEIYHKKLFDLPNKSSGTHRMDGIFIIKGSAIKNGYIINNARILDVAPTILYSLGLPVPEDMDGRVLKEVFTEGYLQGHAVRYGQDTRLDIQRGEGIFDKEESEKIKSSLRDLGYMG